MDVLCEPYSRQCDDSELPSNRRLLVQIFIQPVKPDIRRRRSQICDKLSDLLMPRNEQLTADVIADRAAAVMFAHNHPSVDLRRSVADLRMHSQLREAGTILGLRVVDHIIVGKKGFYSVQESGLVAV